MPIDRDGLLKELTFAGNDPGHAGRTNGAKNYKGDRCMGRWIADAVMVGPIFSAILAQADSAERVAAADAEDLIVPLARDLAREGGWPDPDAPWTENQSIIARGGAGAPVYQEFLDDARSLLGREALRSILSRSARLSAEVERLRAGLDRITKSGEVELAPTIMVGDRGCFNALCVSGTPSLAVRIAREVLTRTALSAPGTDAPAAAQEESE